MKNKNYKSMSIWILILGVLFTFVVNCNKKDNDFTQSKFVVITGGYYEEPGSENDIITAYSSDGVKWKQAAIPRSTLWLNMCYGKDKFVVLGHENKIAHSVDGIKWEVVTIPVRWESICYGNGKFAATSWGEKAGYSEDGIKWEITALPSNAKWESICYGNDKFVAIANRDMYATTSNKAAYSTDGINWKQATLPSSERWTSVSYGNGKFVAVADSSRKEGNDIAAYSTDGINWKQTTLPAKDRWMSVCYGKDKFVAITFDTVEVAYSTDGIKWDRTRLPDKATGPPVVYSTSGWNATSGKAPKYNVCYGKGKFVTIACDTDKVAYSTDGIKWKMATLPRIADWHKVFYGGAETGK